MVCKYDRSKNSSAMWYTSISGVSLSINNRKGEKKDNG
jgi:hypothetical protein